jgi:hypothetical protein
LGDTLADGIAVIRGSAIARQIDSLVGSTALTIDTLRPRVRESPLHLLSPPEDTFNFTITFNVPTGAPTGLHTFHINLNL